MKIHDYLLPLQSFTMVLSDVLNNEPDSGLSKLKEKG